MAHRLGSYPGRGRRSSAAAITAYQARAASSSTKVTADSQDRSGSAHPSGSPLAAVSLPAASAEMASAPHATQWSPAPSLSWWKSKCSSTSTYSPNPATSSTTATGSGQVTPVAAASVAPSTPSDCVATQVRYADPGTRRPSLRTTCGSSTTQPAAATASSTHPAAAHPSSTTRVPSTEVAATPVSEAAVRDSRRHCSRAPRKCWRKIPTSSAQPAPPTPSSTRDTTSAPTR